MFPCVASALHGAQSVWLCVCECNRSQKDMGYNDEEIHKQILAEWTPKSVLIKRIPVSSPCIACKPTAECAREAKVVADLYVPYKKTVGC